MELRGFDSYEVTLGDLMRGERASMGKSLIDAERDMRIKANLIDAIENCDLSAFKNHGVVSGYVRSYARYLGMDVDAAYQRFCEESGFRPPTVDFATPSPAKRGKRGNGAADGGTGPSHALTQSRFAVPPAPSRLRAAVSLSGIASTSVLLALIAGLGYGGYALLQEVQRVGFAPLPEAPSVVAEAPLIVAPEYEPDRPDPSVYQANGALAGITLPSELPLPAVPERDGPISAIDPEKSGLYAPPPEPEPVIPADALEAGAADLASAGPVALPTAADPAMPTAPAGPPTVTVEARGEAWIRIRAADETIVFEGILRPGKSFTLPESVEGAMLRAGNAGDVFVVINGSSYGPVGAPGAVARNVSLVPEDVRASLKTVAAPPAPDAGPATRSADASAD